MQGTELLMRALGLALGNRQWLLSEDIESALDSAIVIAKKQEVSGLLFEGLSRAELALPPEVQSTLLLRAAAELRHVETQCRSFATLAGAFEERGIDYIPLKGAALRPLYPRPELRVGRDVDVLVRPSDLERAVECALSALKAKTVFRSDHDVSLVSADGVHFELHFSLLEKGFGKESVLARPWEVARSQGSHCYQLPDDVQLCYLFSHIAKHLRHGGCGVRPLLDVYLFSACHPESLESAFSLLAPMCLDEFARTLLSDARTFFTQGEWSEEQRRLCAFFLSNGSFGTFRSHAALREAQGKRKAPTRFFFSRALPPYSHMVVLFPILRKLPVLLPFCWVIRGTRLLRRKDRARFFAIQAENSAATSEEAMEMQRTLAYLKLPIP